jgi:hypothetical protein
MVDRKNSGISILLIVVAGMASVAVSAFGLFAGTWGGFLGGPGKPFSLLQLIFWLLPSLCFPSFCVTLVSRRIGLPILWAVPIGVSFALFIVNWRTCMEGHCTTTNPVVIALGTFVALGPFSPFIWVSPVCMQFVEAELIGR